MIFIVILCDLCVSVCVCEINAGLDLDIGGGVKG